MANTSRGARLARRYPQLKDVPEAERPAIVRAALMNPIVLLAFIAVGLLVLPHYLFMAFAVLGVEQEPNLLFKLAKLAGIALVPIMLAVPLLTKYVMPRFIRKEMIKRGYIKGE